MAVAVATTLLVLVVAYLSSPVTGIRVEGADMYPESDAWNAVSKHASLLTLNVERLGFLPRSARPGCASRGGLGVARRTAHRRLAESDRRERAESPQQGTC